MSAGSPSPSPTRSAPCASTSTTSDSRCASTCALRDGGRWVQVAAPGGRVPVALVAAGEGGPVGVDTRITLTTADAEADHAALAAAGVDTDELLAWPGVPAMFIVRDLDGNQLKVMEGVAR